FATAIMTLTFLWSVLTFSALFSLDAEERINLSDGFTWISAGALHVDFRFLVDPLSATMILFITGVGALIHLYSIGYMHGDPRFSRFFAYLNLFAASMLVLVLGSSFVLTYLGWEGVALCSYLLVAFWFERNAPAVAGKKAFVTNRVGDVGFLLGMFLLFSKVGTLDYFREGEAGIRLFGQVDFGGLSNTTVTAIALLLFVGAIGKSAQVPLHIWLPDAMEGPTPVSALIHAATMVTAGVYLVCRANPFFEISDHAGTVVAWIGVITALFAATAAVVQNDIKRVLAYSTISQLGYMFLAAGVGAYSAAMFHMITHAFFKALLFLAAGSVIHGLHDEQDMRRMGGLRKWMPVTSGVFIVGWLAIAGIFPFAGFWSKDEILGAVWLRDDYALWFVGAVTALLTAFYMTRQVWLVFYADERWRETHTTEHEIESAVVPAEESVDAHADPHGSGAPRESPWTMTGPLVVLAGLATFGGLINLPFLKSDLDFLTLWLEPVFHEVPEVVPNSFAQGFILSTVALTVAFVGILLGRAFYKNGLRADGTDPVEQRLGGFSKVLENAYYLDVGVAKFVSGPATKFAEFLTNGVDRTVIDGAVDGIGRGFSGSGSGLRKLQTGLVRNYALGISLGAVLLIGYVAVRTVTT
ncbi:MAG TPA: NADH-quinone oxidoreductase subunit L, partial [Acidimicrobiia bacterium]|nr:NADH-quinone oxidoreductase subunit L [Acidimicrobiia bacterium]